MAPTILPVRGSPAEARRRPRMSTNTKILVAPVLVLGWAVASAEPLQQVPLYPDADMTRYSGNNVELGAVYTTDDAYKFGEYTGLTDEGAYALLNLFWGGKLGGRNAWSVAATNLGLDSRSVGARFGAQGVWFVDADFLQLNRAQWSDARFIHDGLGGPVLTLPAAFPGLPGQPPTSAA